MNGPFFPPADVLQLTLSILDAPLLLLAEAEAEVPEELPEGGFPSRGAGRGRIGRSLVVAVLADEVDVDAGDDFDEVALRGEGPATSGEGVSVGMLGGVQQRV